MRRYPAALAIPGVAVAVAVSGGTSSAAGTTAPTAAASAAKKIELEKTNLGKVLADGHGRTVYMFEKDKRGSKKSTCFGQCAAAWPPVTTTGKPEAGRGVSASKLGTIRRGNGVRQVTYNRWPLYRFQGDPSRQTNGEGIDAFGAEWYSSPPPGRRSKRRARQGGTSRHRLKPIAQGSFGGARRTAARPRLGPPVGTECPPHRGG